MQPPGFFWRERRRGCARSQLLLEREKPRRSRFGVPSADPLKQADRYPALPYAKVPSFLAGESLQFSPAKQRVKRHLYGRRKQNTRAKPSELREFCQGLGFSALNFTNSSVRSPEQPWPRCYSPNGPGALRGSGSAPFNTITGNRDVAKRRGRSYGCRNKNRRSGFASCS